jgi:hypothetical protein
MRSVCWTWLCLPLLASAQGNWVDAGMPGRTVGSLLTKADEQEDRLLAIGQITYVNDYASPAINSYANGVWSAWEGFRGNTTDVTHFGDTLLVCGTLYAVVEGNDSVPVSRIAAFYDGAWHPYGNFSSLVRRLKVLDGELYAIGAFRYADGVECNGVAKRVGGQWVNVGQLEVEPPTNTPNLVDAIKYQGDLYVCGVVNLAPNGENGIVRFDGQNWSAPGGGLFGGVAGGRAMAIFQDELYLGGSFYLSAGNAGHMIQRWNGTEWRPVGGHLRDRYNSTNGAARCYALFEYDGKLLAAGGFQYAGGVPAQTFAIWDGERWCGTGDAINNESHSIALYQDTLYLASGWIVNGDSTNRLVKWISGPLESVICSEPLGTPDITDTRSISLYPNPASTHTTFTWTGTGRVEHQLFDHTGRLVRSGSAMGSGIVTIPLEGIPPGLYHLRITAADRHPASLKLIVP